MEVELSPVKQLHAFKDNFNSFPYSMCLIKKEKGLTIEYLNDKASLLLRDIKLPISLKSLLNDQELMEEAAKSTWSFNLELESLALHVKCSQMEEFPSYYIGLIINIGELDSEVIELNRIIIEQTNLIVLQWYQKLSYYQLSAGTQTYHFHGHIQQSKWDFLKKEDVHPEDWELVKEAYHFLQDSGNQTKLTIRLKDIYHQYSWCHLTFYAEKQNNLIHKMVITINNVDESVKNRQSLEYRAEYDPLTGYYNFGKFKTLAKSLIESHRDKLYAICYTDLKNFKFLNDIYGYEEGDQILKYWADKLNLVSREDESFARVSADHFATLRTYENIDDLVSRFHHSVRELYKYQNTTNKKFPLEVSAGFYLVKPNDTHSIEDMLDRANIASKNAKQHPGNQFAFYDDGLRESVIVRKELEADMHAALKEQQFEVYFQPIVDIINGNRVTAVEALVRWHHPHRGIIPPNDFIPLFERNGFIVDLDLYMFEKVCQYIQKNKITNMIISVNVSRISAFQADFVKRYIALKAKYQVPDAVLELECTETTVANNPRELNDILSKLKGHGFLFAIDDFGSGYSSLNVLKEVPAIDVLKLDRIFCTEDLQDGRNHAIVSSVITMAKKLNMRVIAEGVESLHQCEVLRGLDCDFIQGYLFDRPMPIAAFDKKYPGFKN